MVKVAGLKLLITFIIYIVIVLIQNKIERLEIGRLIIITNSDNKIVNVGMIIQIASSKSEFYNPNFKPVRTIKIKWALTNNTVFEGENELLRLINKGTYEYV
jgi:hypothetical protein